MQTDSQNPLATYTNVIIVMKTVVGTEVPYDISHILFLKLNITCGISDTANTAEQIIKS
jgi:hypothetical protein